METTKQGAENSVMVLPRKWLSNSFLKTGFETNKLIHLRFRYVLLFVDPCSQFFLWFVICSPITYFIYLYLQTGFWVKWVKVSFSFSFFHSPFICSFPSFFYLLFIFVINISLLDIGINMKHSLFGFHKLSNWHSIITSLLIHSMN